MLIVVHTPEIVYHIFSLGGLFLFVTETYLLFTHALNCIFHWWKFQATFLDSSLCFFCNMCVWERERVCVCVCMRACEHLGWQVERPWHSIKQYGKTLPNLYNYTREVYSANSESLCLLEHCNINECYSFCSCLCSILHHCCKLLTAVYTPFYSTFTSLEHAFHSSIIWSILSTFTKFSLSLHPPGLVECQHQFRGSPRSLKQVLPELSLDGYFIQVELMKTGIMPATVWPLRTNTAAAGLVWKWMYTVSLFLSPAAQYCVTPNGQPFDHWTHNMKLHHCNMLFTPPVLNRTWKMRTG